MSKGSKAKRAKPPVAQAFVPLPDVLPCHVCGAAMTREYGSLMCSDKTCVAYRGKA